MKIFLIYPLFLSSCFLKFWGEDEKKPHDPRFDGTGFQAEHVEVGSLEELSLKHAKLWSRVDEMEELVSYQKERIRLLEKGLMLGIIPDELKEKDAKPKVLKVQPMAVKKQPAVVGREPPTEEETTEQEKPDPNSIEEKAYQERLAKAQEHYQEGRYGRAIAEYSVLGREYPQRIEGGSHVFWIAQCWAKLKEFQTARQHFSNFIQQYPMSPWVPRAKLELARVEYNSGLKEKSQRRLSEIIRDHPYEDAAEMAKMELENQKKAL